MKEQTSLDLLSSTFSSALQSPLLSGSLRSLKRHLYNRSFADAFPTSSGPRDGAEDQNALMLEAYVVRWVPTRALCYSRIIGQVAKYLQKSDLRVVCIGAGCGSETLALQSSLSCELNVDVVDSCPGWEPILSRITQGANKTSLTTATVNFHHGDIVSEYSKFKELFTCADFVTLMFTLNELITTQGKVPATKFLVELIKAIPKGSLILIVDSPTYSVIEVAGKHFPASFLVDRLPGLEKVWEVESEWFRVDKDLRYPIPLENMRYFGMLMKKK